MRLPAGVDPNQQGLTVTCFSGRVEAVWRKSGRRAATRPASTRRAGDAEPLPHDGSRRHARGDRRHRRAALAVRVPRAAGRDAARAADADAGRRGPERRRSRGSSPWSTTACTCSCPSGESPAGHCDRGRLQQHQLRAGVRSAAIRTSPTGRTRVRCGPTGRRCACIARNWISAATRWSRCGPAASRWRSRQGFELDPADPTGGRCDLLDEVRLDARRPGRRSAPTREDR